MRTLLTVLVGFVWAASAQAFPDLVRHGYFQCTTCHVSPSGGGVLTEYGRALSLELLSTKGTEKETRPLYFIDQVKNLNIGGDVRTAEVYVENERARSGRLILMQADVELAYTWKSLTAVASGGYQERQLPTDPSWLSRRHYLIARPLDAVYVRSGKVLPDYGLNLPDHVVLVRRGLLLNDRSFETYLTEAGYEAEKWNVKASRQWGSLGLDSVRNDQGWLAKAEVEVTDNSKVGVSGVLSESETDQKRVLGTHWILGFTPKFYALTEWDLLWRTSPQKARGFGSFVRTGYEFEKGFHGYLQHELLRSDFSTSDSLRKAFGLGVLYFPRPHFEFQLQWQMQTRRDRPGYTDYAFFLFHYYI